MSELAIPTRKQQIEFPTVANIRKGGPKEKRTKDGREYETVGKDLNDRFRVVFEPGMEYYAKRFREIYKTYEPKIINAMMPFAEIGECYEVSNEAYQAGMLVFKAVNGRVIVHRDPTTSEYLVRGGEAMKPGVSLEYDPFEQSEITYKGHDGSTKSLPIKTQTRLKLFIPEMRELVWFLLKTTSYYDSLNIQNNMAAVQAVANSATGGNVAGVRINVFRAQQDILWNSDKGPRRIKKWLIQVKIDPDWVEKMIVRMSANTLNAGSVAAIHELPAPMSAPNPEQDISDDENEQEEQDFIDAEYIDAEEDQAEPADLPTEKISDKRPYSPSILKIKLTERAKGHEGKGASPAQRKLVVALLAEYFAGDDDKRHATQEYLFGALSLNETTDAQILAALDWLEPEKNPDQSGTYLISDMAREELSSVWSQALTAKGQEVLFW